MKTTKIALISFGTIATLIFLVFRYSFILGVCSSDDYRCWDTVNYWHDLFSFAHFFFFFLVIASFFSRNYFIGWLRLAWWGGAIVAFFIIRVNLGIYRTPGGFFNMDDVTDKAITALAYAFFIIGSFIQLLRVYLKNRRQKSP